MGNSHKNPSRSVILCRFAQLHQPRARGGRQLLWAFSIDDLSMLLGQNADKVRRRIRAGDLDPTDLGLLFSAVVGGKSANQG
jgi:hypothetical protein